MIRNENFTFPHDIKISESLKKLIVKMLEKSENERISII